MLQSVLRTIDRLSKWSCTAFSWLVIPIFLSMGLEVVLRYGFNRPTIWANELSQLIFGVYFVIGGAYTALHSGHVSMDLFYRKLGGRKQAILSVITTIVFATLFLVLLLWAGVQDAWRLTLQNRSTGSLWDPPLWPARWGFVMAVLLLILQMLANFVRDLHKSLTGRELQ